MNKLKLKLKMKLADLSAKVRLAQLAIRVNQAVRFRDLRVLEGVLAQSGLRDLQVRYTLCRPSRIL